MKKLLVVFLISSITFPAMSQTKSAAGKKSNYGKNIIAFNPVHLIASDFVGVGFSYERLVNDYLGLKVPVMLAINNNYFNVGLESKLYPTKNNGPVKYAIAPTIMAGIGESSYENYVYINGNYYGINLTEVSVNSGDNVNFIITKHQALKR
jgi:hypothetical protein